jgi:hypothetical protein
VTVLVPDKTCSSRAGSMILITRRRLLPVDLRHDAFAYSHCLCSCAGFTLLRRVFAPVLPVAPAPAFRFCAGFPLLCRLSAPAPRFRSRTDCRSCTAFSPLHRLFALVLPVRFCAGFSLLCRLHAPAPPVRSRAASWLPPLLRCHAASTPLSRFFTPVLTPSAYPQRNGPHKPEQISNHYNIEGERRPVVWRVEALHPEASSR